MASRQYGYSASDAAYRCGVGCTLTGYVCCGPAVRVPAPPWVFPWIPVREVWFAGVEGCLDPTPDPRVGGDCSAPAPYRRAVVVDHAAVAVSGLRQPGWALQHSQRDGVVYNPAMGVSRPYGVASAPSRDAVAAPSAYAEAALPRTSSARALASVDAALASLQSGLRGRQDALAEADKVTRYVDARQHAAKMTVTAPDRVRGDGRAPSVPASHRAHRSLAALPAGGDSLVVEVAASSRATMAAVRSASTARPVVPQFVGVQASAGRPPHSRHASLPRRSTTDATPRSSRREEDGELSARRGQPSARLNPSITHTVPPAAGRARAGAEPAGDSDRKGGWHSSGKVAKGAAPVCACVSACA